VTQAKPRLSLVVPAFNEAAGLPELARRLCALDAVIDRETVLIDDGSSDGTWEAIVEIARADQRTRGLGLARNSGSQRALLAGIAHARGDAIVTLDADLQHPPELIPKMIEAWRGGAEIVEMERENDAVDGALRGMLTPAFYALFNWISPLPLSPRSTDFRLIDRRCVAPLVAQTRAGLVRTLVQRLARPTATLRFAVPPRFAGRSRYDLPLLLRTATHALAAAALPLDGGAPIPIVRTVGEGLP
jgi:dolichol-phosphate mannosyltransferase